MPASAWNGTQFMATVSKHEAYQVRVTQPTPVAISSATGIFVLVFLIRCHGAQKEAAKGKKLWRGLGVSFRIVPTADTREKATGYTEDHGISDIQRCKFVLGHKADILATVTCTLSFKETKTFKAITREQLSLSHQLVSLTFTGTFHGCRDKLRRKMRMLRGYIKPSRSHHRLS
ncbi:uncharacterized protein HD556DRAFT_1302783 [Suillus plorans]|uniref:Uncharacterized protein n=1 Tax=Suillus plorans TaxID=116603 RepID=A0A9P7J9T6_9AGAM|nr:uncharacterized protein HD556DRAFT_1302783 [Suillus plorans]KAG1810496.1 hypothetical protein HD556DRAFT_1302783 [Suillus plorans]